MSSRGRKRKAAAAAQPDGEKAAATAPDAVAAANEDAAAAPASAADAGESTAEGEQQSLDYEARRQAQIQRNQALLSRLTGVASASTSLTASAFAASLARQQASQESSKAARALARKERLERFAMLPRRDLPPRRARRSDVDYSEDAIALRAASSAAVAAAAPSAAAAAATGSDSEDEVEAVLRANASLSDFVVPDHAPLGRVPASGNGTSSKQAHTRPLAELALHLGESIPLRYHAPKASAMSFLFAGWPGEDNVAARRAPPSFNKMSGIQKLARHVAIFINVDEAAPDAAPAPGGKGGYSNQWSANGRRITWFAQPTQRVDTPVIGEIIAAARDMQRRLDGSAQREGEEYAREVLGAAAGSEIAVVDGSASAAAAAAASAAAPSKRGGSSKRKAASPSPSEGATAVKLEGAPSSSAAASFSSPPEFDPPSVLLFLRHVGGAYLYAGRLAYEEHDTRRTPMRFVFTLADFDVLAQKEDFRKLLPSAMAEEAKKAAGAAAAKGETKRKPA